MAPARKRRQGVSGESVNPQQMDAFISPVHAKTPEERQAILASIDSKLKVLFGHLSLEHKLKVVDAFFPKAISVDETVIKQGDEGDNFYVIKEGCFDIYVTRPGAEAQKVKTCSAGDFFGELALLYNAPRAATVVVSCAAHSNAGDNLIALVGFGSDDV
ncbi:MAG: hypothetical protein KVP17_000683 [Porospora cf. gigantea B]|uniref:uncharacterized protein n=1 Tax=Porospora cf. gigantea B TaxID=2853592 RepID=UPI0035718F5B|nr:MAG: hypothetical protein KVP17_000683 [Porospora cf. gigantea B]